MENGQTEQLAVARPAIMIQAATKDHQLTLTIGEARELRDQLDLAIKSIEKEAPPPAKSKGKAPASARAKRQPRGAKQT